MPRGRRGGRQGCTVVTFKSIGGVGGGKGGRWVTESVIGVVAVVVRMEGDGLWGVGGKEWCVVEDGGLWKF